jgi:hypothetical protein
LPETAETRQVTTFVACAIADMYKTTVFTGVRVNFRRRGAIKNPFVDFRSI